VMTLEEKYGQDFQSKVIAYLIFEPNFLPSVFHATSAEYFDTDEGTWLVEALKSYYQTHETLPTKAAFDVLISKIEDIDDRARCSIYLEECLSATGNCTDIEVVKNAYIDFCRLKEYQQFAVRSIELARDGKYDDISQGFQDILKIGYDTDIGYDVSDDFESKYDEESREVIPTPWEVVNNLTNGGMGRQELAVFGAPQGHGKSWILALLAAHAASLGLNAVYYTLELGRNAVARRMDSLLTKVPLNSLVEQKSIVRSRLKTTFDKGGKLIVKSAEAYSFGIEEMTAHIQTLVQLDKKPDIILVDYADLMRLEKGEFRVMIDKLYHKLRNLGKKYNAAVATATQVGKAGITDNWIDGSATAEAFSKNNAPDFIMTMNRPGDDTKVEPCYPFISKNRNGNRGVKLIGVFDTFKVNTEFHIADSEEAQGFLDVMNDVKRDHQANAMSALKDVLGNSGSMLLTEDRLSDDLDDLPL
jgi:hypothetical protein